MRLRPVSATMEQNPARKGENTMQKYQALWEYIRQSGSGTLRLSFAEIGRIAGVPLDHSFLQYKKELAAYGYQVAKISMKEQFILFRKIS